MIYESSVWLVAHSDEYSIQCECRSILAEYPSHSHHPSLYLSDLSEVVEYDVRVLVSLFYPDVLSPDTISSYEYVDFTTDLGEIERLSDRCIAPSYDRYFEVFEEVTITSGTIGHPLSEELCFARDS
jgi:hypothetical protein